MNLLDDILKGKGRLEKNLEHVSEPTRYALAGFMCRDFRTLDKYIEKYVATASKDDYENITFGAKMSFVTNESIPPVALASKYVELSLQKKKRIDKALIKFFDKYVRRHVGLGYGMLFAMMHFSRHIPEEEIKKVVDYVVKEKILPTKDEK